MENKEILILSLLGKVNTPRVQRVFHLCNFHLFEWFHLHYSKLTEHVQFHNNDKIIAGVFKSIDSTGNALIDVDNNIKSFSSGVIEL